MKYSTYSNDSALFCEQVQSLTTMYEQWNDCEKTVVIYALFKRLPFANLKFLIHSIDHYLRQSFNTPQRLSHFEDAANAITFLNKLINKYNSLITITTSNDKIDAAIEHELANGEAKNLEDELVSKYASKEEIIGDLLMYLPLLRPNNDEGKKIYMQFLPVLIEDTIKHNLPIELVQQILSYLLIHPAIKNDDRKALNQWLRQLEEHISAMYNHSSAASFNQMPSETASSFLSTASSISSASSSSSSASSTTWPTAVPQPLPSSMGNMFKTKRDQELWDLRNFPTTHDFCEDLNQPKFPTPIGTNKKPSQILNSTKASCVNTSSSIFDTTDEHHISFSKNGKEIVDFSSEISDGSKGSANLAMTTSSASSDYHLTVPSLFSDNLFDMYGFGDAFSDDGSTIKTRRSNSLTTPTVTGDFVTSSSAENLASFQKPRSFSLSTESSRNQLVSSGSDTQLNEYNKMTHMRYNNSSTHMGMGHIGVWLKSLRLHKYFWLFSNMSYEEMLEITEEYLENLGVTKGARHKLVLCIQKLSERVALLKQIEKELMDGSRSIKNGLEELTNIVLTPMKPINSVPNDDDVATHVMKVLDCAFQGIMGIKYLTNADEECVNIFMWVVDKTLHHEAFMQQTAHLRELKYKMQRIKVSFIHNKMHFTSGANKSATTKMRWNNVKPLKTNQSMSSDIQPKIHRKSSMQYYNIQPYGVQNQSVGNKSPSFPNFNNSQTSNVSNFQRSVSREKLNQFSMMQQQHHNQFNQQLTPQGGPQSTQVPAYHRHSLNNLMPFSTSQSQFMNRRNSSCGTDRVINNHSMLSPLSNQEKHLSDSGLSTSMNSTGSPAPTASDINSRLESLCRQMTEQAIN